MGASLFAANLSTSFRLRKFGMTDRAMYGVQLSVDEAHFCEGSEAEKSDAVRPLLPASKKLPVKRVVHFKNVREGEVLHRDGAGTEEETTLTRPASHKSPPFTPTLSSLLSLSPPCSLPYS
jgi:hypothetical protein